MKYILAISLLFLGACSRQHVVPPSADTLISFIGSEADSIAFQQFVAKHSLSTELYQEGNGEYESPDGTYYFIRTDNRIFAAGINLLSVGNRLEVFTGALPFNLKREDSPQQVVNTLGQPWSDELHDDKAFDRSLSFKKDRFVVSVYFRKSRMMSLAIWQSTDQTPNQGIDFTGKTPVD